MEVAATVNRWEAPPLPPEGNSKTEPVKSATIHDGKRLT